MQELLAASIEVDTMQCNDMRSGGMPVPSINGRLLAPYENA